MFRDGNSLAKHGLGLIQLALILQQRREVIQTDGNVRMFVAQQPPRRCQRSASVLLRFGELSFVVQGVSELVHGLGRGGVFGAGNLQAGSEGAAQHGFGFSRTLFSTEENTKIVLVLGGFFGEVILQIDCQSLAVQHFRLRQLAFAP